jgi:hypothetical protein
MNRRRAMMGAAVLCLSSQRPARALLAMVRRWRISLTLARCGRVLVSLPRRLLEIH